MKHGRRERRGDAFVKPVNQTPQNARAQCVKKRGHFITFFIQNYLKLNDMSCPYKSLFGDPRTGSHAMRIPVLDISVTDTALTFVGAWAIQHWFFPKTPYWKVFLVFFLIGELMHYLFCVKTRVLEYAGVL